MAALVALLEEEVPDSPPAGDGEGEGDEEGVEEEGNDFLAAVEEGEAPVAFLPPASEEGQGASLRTATPTTWGERGWRTMSKSMRSNRERNSWYRGQALWQGREGGKEE